MAIALIIWVVIRLGRGSTIVSVANKVVAIGDLATRTKATTKALMTVVDAAVDDADADTLASDTLLVEFVYSCHNVYGGSCVGGKGGVVGATKDKRFLWDGAWDEGDRGNSDDIVSVGQMDEVLIILEGNRNTEEEVIVIFVSEIPVNTTTGKMFVEICVGLEGQSVKQC